MKVLVTGATGFIGTHLCRHLVEQGHEVRAFVRSSTRARDAFGSDMEIAEGNVRNVDELTTAMQDVEVVFHLAALVVAAGASEADSWDVNVGGTRNVCDAMKRAGIRRLIHCSSVGVFGPIVDPPADENYPKQPQFTYEKTKKAAEDVVVEFMQRDGLEPTIIRPAVVYGPGDTRSGMFALFQAIKKRRFFLLGNGKNYIHTLYVKNLVQVFGTTLKRPSSIGRDYNIGDAYAPTLKAICETIAAAEGVPFSSFRIPLSLAWGGAQMGDLVSRAGVNVPINSRSVTFLTTHRSYDISRARAELGYTPQHSLQSGVAQTAEWYSEHGYL